MKSDIDEGNLPALCCIEVVLWSQLKNASMKLASDLFGSQIQVLKASSAFSLRWSPANVLQASCFTQGLQHKDVFVVFEPQPCHTYQQEEDISLRESLQVLKQVTHLKCSIQSLETACILPWKDLSIRGSIDRYTGVIVDCEDWGSDARVCMLVKIPCYWSRKGCALSCMSLIEWP